MELHHSFKFLINKELGELYIAVLMRFFAFGLISVFIPIYLMQLGFSLGMVLLYYITMWGTHALTTIPVAKLAGRFGFKHIMIIGVPFTIAYFALLHMLETLAIPLLFIAVIQGVQNSLFWLGYHTNFSKHSKKRDRGKQLGVARLLRGISSVAAPATGGIILTFFGWTTLFLVVICTLVISVIPLLFTKDIFDPFHLSLRKLFIDRPWRDVAAFIGYGMQGGTIMVLWPIYIFFVILTEYASLGFVTSLLHLGSFLMVFIAAKFADVDRRLVLRFGSLWAGFIWAIKMVLTSARSVFIVDGMHGLAQTTISIPFDALSYDKANKEESLVGYIIFRETTIQIGKIALFLALFFLGDIKYGFVMASLGALLMMLF